MSGRWQHFPHEADIGLRGIGDSEAEAFEQAALALTAAITRPKDVASLEQVRIECQAPDHELLLVDWLNALIYEMATRRMLFADFQVQLEGDNLQATAWGEPVQPRRHRPAVEVKGATYTQLQVREHADGQWVAQCVVDV